MIPLIGCAGMPGRTGSHPSPDSTVVRIKDGLPGSSQLLNAVTFTAALIAVLIAGPQAAEAGDSRPDPASMSIEELMNVEVYTASRHPQSASEAPASVTVITADDIQRYGYRTLADALKSVRGFYIDYDRNYSYVGVRGFAPPGDYNTRILLLIDGHRINDAVYHQASVGTEFPLDVDAIERIEIVRGASSSLYGSDAFFAVVNVITKSRASVKNGAVSAEGGSYGSYKSRFAFGSTLSGKADLFVSGSMYGSRGADNLYFPEFDDPSTNNGIAHRVDDDEAEDLLIKLTAGGFMLQSMLGTREKGIPTAPYGTAFDNPRTRTTDSEGTLALSYARQINDTSSVMSSLSYNRYNYSGDWLSVSEAGGTPPVFNRDITLAEWWSWNGQLRTNIKQHHEITVGGDFQRNSRQNQKNYDVDPYSLYLDVQRDSLQGAGFIQDEFRIHPKLILNAGIRHDEYSTFGGSTSPRLGLLFRAAEHTNLKFLYGHAFRAPNDYELYYESGTDTKANPNLRPERIRNIEGVLEQYIGSHIQLTASGYYYFLYDSIRQVLDSDGAMVFQNSGEIRAKGLEFEARGQWKRNLQTAFNYSLQRASDNVTGVSVPNSPKHLAKANVQLPLFQDKLFVSAEGQYTSRRTAVSGYSLGGFGTANLTLLAKSVGRNFNLSFSVYNLFDKQYGTPGAAEHLQVSIPQDGRSFRLKAGFSF